VEKIIIVVVNVLFHHVVEVIKRTAFNENCLSDLRELLTYQQWVRMHQSNQTINDELCVQTL
jgi:hypothetical protein